MLIDHIGIPVTDLGRSRRFYARALAPLQIGEVAVVPDEAPVAAGFGKTADSRHIQAGKPSFWIGQERLAPSVRTHIAFLADTRAEVDAFHAAALAAGGTDNGGPGVRPHYHPNYYAAFVLDPDGHNVEAVCHEALKP